jgi:hypothetical protein
MSPGIDSSVFALLHGRCKVHLDSQILFGELETGGLDIDCYDAPCAKGFRSGHGTAS